MRHLARFSASDFNRPLTSHTSAHPIISLPSPPPRPQTPVTPDLATSERFPHRSQKAVISPCCPRASAGRTSRPRLKAQETSKSFGGSGGGVGGGADQRTGTAHSMLSGPGPQTTIWRPIRLDDVARYAGKMFLTSALEAAKRPL